MYMRRFITAQPLLLALALSACSGPSGDEYLARAKELLQQADREAAVLELKNALQVASENGEARWLLGRTYFELGEYEAAEKEINRARDAGVPESTVAAVLAQVLLAQRDHERLEQLSGEGLSPQDRSTVMAARAASLMQTGSPGSAELTLDAALAAGDVSPFALVTAAGMSLEQGAPVRARTQLQEVLEVAPEYGPAWGLLGDIEAQAGNLEAAEAAYTKAIEIGPVGLSDLLDRAMVRFQLEDLEGAGQDVRGLLKLSPEHPGVNTLSGLLKVRAGDLEGAQESLDLAARYGSAAPDAYYYLAAVQWRLGSASSARYNLDKFLALKPDNPRGLKLAATIALQSGDFSDAEELIRPVVDFHPEDLAARNLLANALMGLGDPEGIEILTELGADQPDSPETRTRLAAGLIASGQEALGIEQLQKTLELYPDHQQAELLLVLNHLEQGDVAAASVAAEEFLQRSPDSSAAHNLRARVHVAAGENEQAIAAYKKAAELAPGNPAAYHSLAELALRSGDADGARAYYQAVLDQYPDNLQTLIKLAASHAREEDAPAMTSTLQRAIKAHPDALEPRLLLARHYLGTEQPEQVAEVFSGLDDEANSQPEVLYLSGAAQLAQGNFNQALATVDTLVGMRPGVADYHFLKARAYAGLGDEMKAINELNKVLEASPQSVTPRLARARFALITDQLDLFERDMKVLKELAPEHPSVMRLEVSSARMAGDDAGADQLQEAVFDLHPTFSTMVMVANQRAKGGNLAGAEQLVEDWIAEHDDDLRAREALAAMYYRAGNTAGAAEQYRQILEIDADNLNALNNQAWMLREAEPAQALAYAERAGKLAPESPQVLDTLALVLLSNDEVQRAARTIDRAVDLQPENRGLRFHQAQIRLAQGDKAQAVEVLSMLLADDQPFRQRSEAEALLKGLQ